DISLHRERRNAIAPPDNRSGLRIFERGKLAEGNGAPVGQGNGQLPQRCKRGALFVRRANNHVDQIDVVANLRDRDSGNDGVEYTCEGLRAQTEEPRLILVDLNAHFAREFYPIEVDVLGTRVCGDDLGEFEGNLADLRDVRPADAILHRPSNGWTKLERVDA